MAAFGQRGRRARRARSSPRSIALSITRQRATVLGDVLAAVPSQNLSRSLRRVLAAARAPLSTRALASATAALTLERSQIVEGRAARATKPPATSVAMKGAADTLRSSVSRVIDLRTDIVILLADAPRTGGWSASCEGGTRSSTRIARLRGAAGEPFYGSCRRLQEVH